MIQIQRLTTLRAHTKLLFLVLGERFHGRVRFSISIGDSQENLFYRLKIKKKKEIN